MRFLRTVGLDVGVEEADEILPQVLPDHLEEEIVLSHVVDGKQDVRIHFLNLQHVAYVGPCVVLAGVAVTARGQGLMR